LRLEETIVLKENILDFIDFHTHIYPDAIAAKAADSIRVFYGFGNKAMDGTAWSLGRRFAKGDMLV